MTSETEVLAGVVRQLESLGILIIRKDRPFSREELARRQRVVVAGMSAAFATPEDTVLSKLE